MYDKHNTRDTYLHICIFRAAAGGGYVTSHRCGAPGISGKQVSGTGAGGTGDTREYQLPFVEEAGYTVSLSAGLKSTIGSLAALALNLIIENYITIKR